MFYLCLLAHSGVKYSSLYEWHSGWLIRGRNCLSLASACVHLRLWGGLFSLSFEFSVLSCGFVFCLSSSCVLCAKCCVSGFSLLDWPFDFSNVYSHLMFLKCPWLSLRKSTIMWSVFLFLSQPRIVWLASSFLPLLNNWSTYNLTTYLWSTIPLWSTKPMISSYFN